MLHSLIGVTVGNFSGKLSRSRRSHARNGVISLGDASTETLRHNQLTLRNDWKLCCSMARIVAQSRTDLYFSQRLRQQKKLWRISAAECSPLLGLGLSQTSPMSQPLRVAFIFRTPQVFRLNVHFNAQIFLKRPKMLRHSPFKSKTRLACRHSKRRVHQCLVFIWPSN